GYLLLAPHENKPNMIGQVATILGGAGININGMQVGSTTQDNTNIMAVAVGNDIANDIMLRLRGIEGIFDVKLINCEC
ncbi:MAG: phosphoglycerate dehydrogenase, partial [Phascolarctobacterium sp.]|nr:phosphoglycerate dehydrogenase [Phascolarctobacterium sp.]